MNLIRLYRHVLALLAPEMRLSVVLACANLALAAAQFADPVLFGRIIDALASAQANRQTPTWRELSILLAAWVGFALFTIVCGTLVALHADRLAHRRRHAVLTDYFEHVLQLPTAFHGGSHSGRLMKIMLSGTDALWTLWLDFFRESFAACLSLLVLLPLSLILNWRLGLPLVIVCFVFAGLTGLIVRKTETLQSSVERHYSDLAERASDALGNVALVQGFARVEAEVRGLREVVGRLLGAQMPVLSWWAILAVLTRASTTLTMLAIFIVGIFLHLENRASIGESVMFTNFAALLIGQLEKVIHFVNRVLMDAPRLAEFFGVFEAVPSVSDRPDAIDPGRLHGLVDFQHVTFSYDGRHPAVTDLSFTALPGETIALVGATGAGKTTALSLLYRAFDPSQGSIKVDGMDVRGLKVSALRRNIGVVFQETLLFNRSVAENLSVGKPDATEEEMHQACARAQALDFVEQHELGFQANVGERGRLLSGGERQRLSIARALLKDPPILILDEATSALDAATEAKVQAALEEAMKNRTTFVIAHRLATVRKAKRILVFEAGRIVETGSFAELMRLQGRFAELARAQFLADAAGALQTAPTGIRGQGQR